MARYKLFFLILIVFLLITVGAFMADLAAQGTKKNSASVQEFINKAQELVERNQLEKAVEIYERIVIAAPDDLESHVQLATLYARIKQHEEAAQTWDKLLEVDPENIKYQDELVNSLQAAGKRNEALEIAQTYIQMYPGVGVHYARLAKLYEAEGNETTAIENYKNATAFGYGDQKIYLRLAEHYFMNEDIAATEKALNNAITYTTSEWIQERIEQQLVNLYRYRGNLEEMLQKAEADGTLTFEMQKQRARHFRNTGELEKAAIHYKKAFEMTDTSSKRNRIANELLNVHLQQDRSDMALDFYETELLRPPRSKFLSTTYSSSGITFRFFGDDTRQTLINVYENQGKLEELRTLFEGKLEKDLDNPAILELLAKIYWDTNDYQKAAEIYHALSTRKTESNLFRKYLAVYQAAAAYWKSNQSDMVKNLLNRAETELASSNLKEHESLLGAFATICLENEMYDPALKLAENAVSEAEDWEGYLYEILAKSYLAVGRYEDAFEAYQQMAKEDNRSSTQKRSETGMNETAKAGRLYEKWIPEQLKQVEESPNDPKRILKLAQSYEAAEKTEEAIVQYERLSELESENSQWYEKLGYLYQNLPQESHETGTVSEELSPEHLAKSITAYEKAIELDPTSYYLYDLLAKSYMKSDRTSDAKKVYRRALGASLSKSNHESAVRAIAGFYADEGQEDKRIAILEEFKPKVDQSAGLHELLGDLYESVGDSEKAVLSYDKWMQIRQKELNRAQSASLYRNFAEKLLDKGLYPEIALNYAKRAFHKDTYSEYDYLTTLGRACIANGLYNEALKHFKHALSLMSDERYSDRFWQEIAEAIKDANDTERYIQMLDTLINSISSESSNARAIIYRNITEFYEENDMSENAEKYFFESGFIPETCWVTLGPFENIDSRGVLYAYIPEETTQIDTTTKYYGRDQLISWKKPSDNKLDGRFDFGNKDGINNDSAAYAWAIVTSPDTRDIVLRFDSDDQGLVWLNGKKVFEHFRTSGVRIDRYTIPVTLKQGENSILVKVGNAWQTWDFYLRLTDVDGKPFGDLKFKNTDELLHAKPPKSTFHVNVNLGMAEYYSKNNMPDKAMEQMRQTGMIHENSWWVLGLFDNTVGTGYNTKYIPEDTTQIDLTAKYEGIDGQIGWKKFTDDAFDGFIDLGRNVNWCVSYAWTTVTSPVEREVQLRFGSDDQAKMWLNGNKVFAYPQFRWAVVDGDIIPVTLKAGKNTILVKVCNEERSWGFYLRVTDTDGKPFKDLKINDASIRK